MEHPFGPSLKLWTEIAEKTIWGFEEREKKKRDNEMEEDIYIKFEEMIMEEVEKRNLDDDDNGVGELGGCLMGKWVRRGYYAIA